MCNNLPSPFFQRGHHQDPLCDKDHGHQPLWTHKDVRTTAIRNCKIHTLHAPKRPSLYRSQAPSILSFPCTFIKNHSPCFVRIWWGKGCDSGHRRDKMTRTTNFEEVLPSGTESKNPRRGSCEASQGVKCLFSLPWFPKRCFAREYALGLCGTHRKCEHTW